MRPIIFFLSVIFVANANAQTNSLKFQSAVKQTALLELYTSEGCSSCPPAETWLTRLKDSPGLWKNFVPVAFHVDYWDYLGWRDPWSDAQFSDRQRAYASAWHNASIYTPGFVLNGREWSAWSWRKDLPTSADAPAGILTVSSMDKNHFRWATHFAPAKADAESCEIHAALLACGLVSDVKAGENRGRHLIHDFVAIAIAEHALTKEAGEFRGELLLNTVHKSAGERLAVVFWVTCGQSTEPVQAVGGWMEEAKAH